MITFLKSHKLAIIIASVTAIVLVILSVMGYFLYQTDQTKRNQAKEISSLNQNIAEQSTKIASLSDSLSQTEEGKKQLETINSTLESDKSKLSTDNAALTQQVTSVQAQLTAKQQELTKLNATVAAKNAELANATRCLNLFTTVQTQYNQFKNYVNQSNSLFEQAINAYDAGNDALGDSLLAQSDAAYNNAMTVFGQMDANMAKLKSGKC